MLKVEEVRTIKVTCQMSPDQWDPNATDHSTHWHKAKLLNQRVEKFAPNLDAVEFYMNVAKFAHEQQFGDLNVIVKVAEEIYKTRLIFNTEST